MTSLRRSLRLAFDRSPRNVASVAALLAAVGLVVVAPVRAVAGPPATNVDADGAPEASAGEPSESPPAFVPPASDAPAPERAKRWFLRGRELFVQARYGEAARAYEASYAAVPAPNTLYNAALSHDSAGHPLQAIDAYERYLDLLAEEDALDPVLSDGVHRARRRVRELTPQVARIELVISTAITPTSIEVDGVARGVDDFPLRVLPGPHKIEVIDADGHRTLEVVELLPAERMRVRVEPPPPSPEPAPAEDRIPPDDGDVSPEGPEPLEPSYVARVERVRIAGWSALGITGASGVAVAVLGGLTLEAKREFEDTQCPSPSCEDRDVPSLKRRFYGRREATNVAIGVAAGFGVTATALLVAGFTGKAKRVPRRALGRRTATVTATADGLEIRF